MANVFAYWPLGSGLLRIDTYFIVRAMLAMIYICDHSLNSTAKAGEIASLSQGRGYIIPDPLFLGTSVVPSINNNIVDLRTSLPSNVEATAPTGGFIDTCSVGGCLNGPYILSRHVLDWTSTLDNTAQEQALVLNGTADRGYVPVWQHSVSSTVWAVSAIYANDAYVSNGGYLYHQAAGPCTSASTGVGPSTWHQPLAGGRLGAINPTATAIKDGTCSWDYAGSPTYSAVLPASPLHTSQVLGLDQTSIYQNRVEGCVPASSGSGPTGTGSDIIDGTCRWSYVGNGLNTAKTLISSATRMAVGGGRVWGEASLVAANTGVGFGTLLGHEDDCGNDNMDSGPGSKFLMVCRFYGGGSDTTFPFLAFEYFGNAAATSKINPHPFGAHYGMFFSGNVGDSGSVVQTSVLYDGTNAQYSMQADAGRTHDATIEDESASARVLRALNSHGKGIDFTDATFTSGLGMDLNAGTGLAMSNGHGVLRYDGTQKALVYSYDIAGNGRRFAAKDDGGFIASGSGSIGKDLTVGGDISTGGAFWIEGNRTRTKYKTTSVRSGVTSNFSGDGSEIDIVNDQKDARRTLQIWQNDKVVLTIFPNGVLAPSGPIKLRAYIFSELPLCNEQSVDTEAVVSDAAALPYRSVVKGGGRTRTPIYCDGSNWIMR